MLRKYETNNTHPMWFLSLLIVMLTTSPPPTSLVYGLAFDHPHIIRQESLDDTLLTAIVPLNERCPDVAYIAVCFSVDSPMDHAMGCKSKHYRAIVVDRSYGLIDDAKAIRFDVPYWEGRDPGHGGEFYNPIVYLELRNAEHELLALDRIRVDPPSKSTLLTQDEQIEAIRTFGPQSPRSVVWIGVSLFVIGAALVVTAFFIWRRPVTSTATQMTTLDGAISSAAEAGWYTKA